MPRKSFSRKAMILPVLAAMLAPLPAAAADAGADAPDRAPLYSCGTGADAGEGYLVLSGIDPQDEGAFRDLRIERQDADGKMLWSFPPAGVDARTAFRFSHSDGPEGYLVTVRFADGDTDYTLYSLYTPPSGEDDMGGAGGGLVSSRGGTLVEDVECGEAPYEFIDYMRRSMSCDSDSPYGPAACAEVEPTRPGPLDVTQIGLS